MTLPAAPFTKLQKLYMLLFGVFLTNAIVAEIIGVKIFSVEQSLGYRPVHWQVMGFVWDINQTAGALNWPLVFITSDVINEYFGREGVRRISVVTAGFIAYSFVIIYLATTLAPAQFWVDVNQGSEGFNINTAFSKIFRQGLGIITGSLTAFLVSQLLDAYVFQKIKAATNSKKLWLRATGSTLISQLIDSFVVIGIAFVLFGNWTTAQWISTATNSYIYKFVVAVLMTPLIYLAHYVIDRYLAEKSSE
jgi:queuosine precursor transporter